MADNKKAFDPVYPVFSLITEEEFIALYGADIIRLCHRFGVRDEEMDIVDRVALRVFGKGIGYAPEGGPFRGYMIRMVKNFCLTRFRKSRPTPIEDEALEFLAGGSGDFTEKAQIAADAKRLLAAARKAVDARRGELGRKVFRLRWEGGLSAAEIGRRLGVPENTVNVTYCRYMADLTATARRLYRDDLAKKGR